MKLLNISQKTVNGKTTAKVEFDDMFIIVCSSEFAENGNDKHLKRYLKTFFWYFGKTLCEEFEERKIQNLKLPWHKRKKINAWNFMRDCDTMHPMRDKFQEEKK